MLLKVHDCIQLFVVLCVHSFVQYHETKLHIYWTNVKC